MKNIALALILFAFANSAGAAIYTQDEGSTTTYSDTPLSKEAQSTSLSVETTSNIVAPVPIAKPSDESKIEETNAENSTESQEKAAAPEVDAITYNDFLIETPKDQTTFQNQPNIQVVLKIEPALKASDKIQIYLDGKPVATPATTLTNDLGLVERGTHQVYATIVNEAGNSIKQSNTITIYVQRARVNQSMQQRRTPSVNALAQIPVFVIKEYSALVAKHTKRV